MTYEDRSEINIAIGKRIKMARRALRISQTVLGQSVGLTFQQIQKYEHGSNRISAALLFALSRSLNVSLEYLYSDVCTFRTDADKVDPRLSQIMSEVERLSDDQKEHILAIATAINDQRTSRRYLKQAA